MMKKQLKAKYSWTIMMYTQKSKSDERRRV